MQQSSQVSITPLSNRPIIRMLKSSKKPLIQIVRTFSNYPIITLKNLASQMVSHSFHKFLQLENNIFYDLFLLQLLYSISSILKHLITRINTTTATRIRLKHLNFVWLKTNPAQMIDAPPPCTGTGHGRGARKYKKTAAC